MMEVEYITECIKNIPDDMRFYSIHDCLGCKESDADRMREIMEKVSLEKFGVKVGLKMEKGTKEEQDDLVEKLTRKTLVLDELMLEDMLMA